MKKDNFVLILGLITIGFVLTTFYTVIYGQVSKSNNSNTIFKPIQVGKNPYGIAIDPIGHKVYVTNFYNNSVSVINGTTDKEIKTFLVENKPFGIAIDPTGHKVYVTNFASNSVSVIDETTDKVINTIKVGSGPYGIAIDPNTHNLYVTNFNSNAVSKIDSINIKNENTTEIQLGKMPGAIAIDPNTHKVYVTNFASNSVSVIDETTDKVINVKEGSGPYGIAIDPNMHKVYVTNYGSNLVSLMDENSNKLSVDVTFKTTPNASSGYIKCDGNSIITNQHILIKYDSTCTAIANKDFQFQSWQENLDKNSIRPIIIAHLSPTIFNYIANYLDSTANFIGIETWLNYSLNFLNDKTDNKFIPYLNSISKSFGVKSTEDSATIHIKKFGNFTANFKELPPLPPLPPEYLSTLFQLCNFNGIGSNVNSCDYKLEKD